jgi:metal-responsive CopG/Arc/MetJ family transcriptional regulator
MGKSMNQFQRKSIQFRPSEWGKLQEIAMKQGFRSRHALIRNAIVQILAENGETPNAA